MEQRRKRTTKKKRKTNPLVHVLKAIGTLVLSVFLIVVITGSIFGTVLTIYVLNFADTTTTVSLEKVTQSNVSRILYNNPDYDEETDDESEAYELYYAYRNNSNHFIWVDIDDVPQVLQDAVVYTEDERFYSHDGVDFKRTFAAFVNVFLPMRRKFGGSTLTQQTIKNITGDNADEGVDGAERKIREVFRSINVEKTYTKEDILQSYLNIVPMGGMTSGEIIGVQAAANYYFGKDVSELDLAESAAFAGMINAPAYNNPVDNIKNNSVRRKYCLDHMLENGAISTQEYEQALNEELALAGNWDYSSETVYDEEMEEQGITDWYLDAAIEEAIDRIADDAGISYEEASSQFMSGGYTVYTNVDIEMQRKMEKSMQNASNFTTYAMDEDEDTLWADFICMDYKGNVKAVVGGRKEKTESRNLYLVTHATRSPGSCIKPIASYAPAIDQDLITWSTLSDDAPIEIEVDGGKIEKWPVNYSEDGSSENWSYKKLFTWQMLMRSLNTLPAQLIYRMTPAYSFNFLREKLDVTTLDEADSDYSGVTVGGLTNGMTLEELVGAYMIFGNGGRKYEVSYVSKIEDSNGQVIYEKTDGYKQAVSDSTSYIMNRMMTYVINDSVGTGRYAKLKKTEVAGKTGTSSDWYDLNFVGCTPDYVSGVWIGYENPETIPTNDYQNIGAIWKNVFGDIAESEEHKKFDDTFEMPDTVQKLYYCTKTGLLSTTNCSSAQVGYFKTSNTPGYCYGGH
ncbi:MAG: transglycosylase domain-containing protein [Ruminococcus sp.]|nr:transglycosylase domain-containing protein [Ruminococcus sp.]